MSVTAVVSTQVASGHEAAFLGWQHRIAAAEARFAGFESYALEPPVSGVQDDWTMVVRFDTDEHLDAWLASAERADLVAEATAFDGGTRVSRVHGGFEAWTTPAAAHDDAPAAWKQNLVVLLMLYPVVFLFGRYVSDPLLTGRGVPFWLALFLGNAVSVALLGWVLVPRASAAFGWWLSPATPSPRRTATGVAVVAVLYAVLLACFAALG